MVRDAEENAEEDAKQRTLIDKRNQGEQLIHATEKSLTDLADQVGDDEKADIESKVVALREAIAGDDVDAIDTASAALGEVTGKLAEKAYAAQQASEEVAAAPEDADTSASANDAVDAEFEEVKDEEDKKAS